MKDKSTQNSYGLPSTGFIRERQLVQLLPFSSSKYIDDTKRSRKSIVLRWLTAFFSLVIVPTCQSMPTQNPPSYTIIINQIESQNIQTVNISNNINIETHDR